MEADRCTAATRLTIMFMVLAGSSAAAEAAIFSLSRADMGKYGVSGVLAH
jgi:hypothetical protein